VALLGLIQLLTYAQVDQHTLDTIIVKLATKSAKDRTSTLSFGVYDHMKVTQALSIQGLFSFDELLHSLLELAPTGYIRFVQLRNSFEAALKLFCHLNKSTLPDAMWAASKASTVMVMITHIRRAAHNPEVLAPKGKNAKLPLEVFNVVRRLCDMVTLEVAPCFKEAGGAFLPIENGAAVPPSTPQRRLQAQPSKVSDVSPACAGCVLSPSAAPRKLRVGPFSSRFLDPYTNKAVSDLAFTLKGQKDPKANGTGAAPTKAKKGKSSKKLKRSKAAKRKASKKLKKKAASSGSKPGSKEPDSNKPDSKNRAMGSNTAAPTPKRKKSPAKAKRPREWFISPSLGKCVLSFCGAQSFIQFLDESLEKPKLTLLVAFTESWFKHHHPAAKEAFQWLKEQGEGASKERLKTFRNQLRASGRFS
jgi:hypothetical protein